MAPSFEYERDKLLGLSMKKHLNEYQNVIFTKKTS